MSKEVRYFAMICALIFGLGALAFPAAAQEAPAAAAQSGVGPDQGVQLEGELEIIHQDFKDGRGRYLYSLKLSDGTRVPLRFLKEPPTHLLTGDHVRANGQLSNGSLLLYSGSTNVKKTPGGSTTTSTSSTPVPYTFGAQSTLIILVNFQDDVVEPYMATDVQNAFFTTANSFITENSYGQASLTGAVVGWYTIPDSVATCNTSQIGTDTKSDTIAAGVNFSNYPHDVYSISYSTHVG